MLSITGLVLLAASIFFFDSTIRFPSLWAVIPVLGSVLVIVGAGPDTLAGRVLGCRPMVWIGLISYSAYLWHQPLFVFARIRDIDGVSATDYLALSSVSLCLAALTYHFIEQPFRNRRVFARRNMFSAAGATAAGLCLFSAIGIATGGFPMRISDKTQAMLRYQHDVSPYRELCHSRVPPVEAACILGPGIGKPITLWGDSHAVELAWQMAEGPSALDTPVRQVTSSACPPILEVEIFGDPPILGCAKKNAAVADFLFKPENRDETVVLVARWNLYFEGSPFDNTEGGMELGAAYLATPKNAGRLSKTERQARLSKLIAQTVEPLLDAGRKVVLVYPVPEVGWDVPERLALQSQLKAKRGKPLSTSLRVFERRSAAARSALDAVSDHPNLIRVHPEALFCESDPSDRCVAQVGDRPLYWDDDHLNGEGAAMLAAEIRRRMDEKGWL